MVARIHTRRWLRWAVFGLLLALGFVPAGVYGPGPAPDPADATGGAARAARHWRALQRPATPPPAAAGMVAWRGQPQPFQVRQGRRLVQGDIDIGPHGNQRMGEVRPEGLGLAGSVGLWPAVGGVAQIPYVVTQGNAALTDAIAHYNSLFAGLIQWVPRSGQADHVDFVLDPNDHSGSASRRWAAWAAGR